MSAPARRPSPPPFVIERFELAWGDVPGPDDPEERRPALLLVMHGVGWRVAAMPIVARLGDHRLPILSVSDDERELVCLIPDELVEELDASVPVTVEQWGRVARAEEPLRRDEIPRRPRPRQKGKRG